MSTVKVAGISEIVLPDSALGLWDRGELHDLLNLPHDGTRVEIIDGTIVVTAAPDFGHSYLASNIAEAVTLASAAGTSWMALQSAGLLLTDVSGGYVPDIVLVESAVARAALEAGARRISADEIEMAVEVTSEGNAENDRKAPAGRTSKWRGYARMEIPYYLLVDRDPKIAAATLYSIPDPGSGAYLHEESRPFGTAIHLPEPFDLRIETEHWTAWS